MIGSQGRPLRFLAIVLGGWTGMRFALVWLPMAEPPSPEVVKTDDSRPAPIVALRATPASVRVVYERSARSSNAAAPPLFTRHDRVGMVARAAEARTFGTAQAEVDASSPFDAIIGAPRPVPPPPMSPAPSRWSGSAWALARGSGGETSVATPQLGASQIGARLAYRIDRAGRLAAVARVAAAVDTRQQEAAIGVEWRPTRLPIRLVVERRIGVSNVRGGFALGVVGGVDQVALGMGFRLDGYAQGGVIARDGGAGYVDGALRAGRHVIGRVDFGLGAWGAAQPGASRMDIGPSAIMRIPVAGRAIRIGTEWRQRVVGDARPGSGPAVALGMDF